MKHLIVRSFCILLCCSAVVADFNGTDNFNDNIRDPAKWIPYGPNVGRLSETNEHLEFTSTGAGHEQDAWIWAFNTGSYTQDWFVVVDTVNLSLAQQQTSIGIVVGNSSDFGDNFIVDLISSAATGPTVSCGWEINGTPNWFAAVHPVTTNAIKLRIAFDSATKTLSSSYDKGNGFSALTNLNVAGWTMSNADSFTAAANGRSESYAVAPGTLYIDNFSVVTPPSSVEVDIFPAVEVGWTSFAGIAYQVQYADDLLTTNWNNLGEATVGNGTTNYVFDSARNSSKRFYRVRIID